MKKGMRFWAFMLAVLMILTMGMTATEAVQAEIISDGDGVIIYLDAGHDGVHSGCHSHQLKEEILNLKIAKYCKAALEEYEGVTVYMCRTSSSCPFPGTNSADDNSARVADAASKNATLYVALHNNYCPASSVRGATIYYPNSSYNKKIGIEGKAVAEEILKQLTKLGLKDRGVQVRNTEDHSEYPDGSKADYYNVIKTSKLNGFPGIIVEHAYMSNSSDVNSFLNSDAKLKKLGEADAKGIVNYYGLKKKKSNRVNLKKVMQTSEDEIEITWSPYEGADYYIVYRRELLTEADEEEPAEYSDWEKLGKTKRKKFVDTDFEEETTYYYIIKAHMEEDDTIISKHSKGFSIRT